MDKQSCDSSDIVTLVLRDYRVKASKEKLAHSSLYFASLFSEKFKDHRQKEFAINYELSLGSLQDFVVWADNEGKPSNSIVSVRYNFTTKKSLQKFLGGSYSELLELLELSVVFMAEKLTEDITEMIICMRPSPDVMLETWVLAGNLGLKALENVALAVSLDRFEELSFKPLLDLSLEHFSKLLCNMNIRSSPPWLMNVREAWIERNGLTTDIPDWSSRFVKGETEDVNTAIKNAKPHYVQCVSGQKLNNVQFIYYWNGETLQELVEIEREIIGTRFIARGFSVYVVGYKRGVNAETFNTMIWRYCCFTRKWYIETILPRRRQDMEIAFLENKLYLFGGDGPTKQPILTVDVYDVHSGVWSTAADIPESDTFRKEHSSCTADGKLVFQRGQSMTCVYDPLTDEWTELHDLKRKCGLGKKIDRKRVLIGSYKYSNTETPVLYFRNTVNTITSLCTADLQCQTYFLISELHKWDRTIMDQQVMNGPLLVSFVYSNLTECVTVEVGEVRFVKEDGKATYQSLEIYNQELHDVSANCFQHGTGCFNLIEPKSLHTTITLAV